MGIAVFSRATIFEVIDEDKTALNKLLNWWSGMPYDYYKEWLSETADTLKKAGMIKDKLQISGKEVEAMAQRPLSQAPGIAQFCR